MQALFIWPVNVGNNAKRRTCHAKHTHIIRGRLAARTRVIVPGWVAAQNYPPSVGQLVAAAKKQIKTIDMAPFKSAFDKNDLGLIVDVREPEEYADGYIPGAINVPRGQIEFRMWTYVGYLVQQRRRSGHEDRRLGEGGYPLVRK